MLSQYICNLLPSTQANLLWTVALLNENACLLAACIRENTISPSPSPSCLLFLSLSHFTFLKRRFQVVSSMPHLPVYREPFLLSQFPASPAHIDSRRLVNVRRYLSSENQHPNIFLLSVRRVCCAVHSVTLGHIYLEAFQCHSRHHARSSTRVCDDSYKSAGLFQRDRQAERDGEAK